MRTSTLITSYLQAFIFVALGLRCIAAWLKDRDKRSAHLASAAGLFGISSLLGAITSTIYDATKGETAPRWEQILSGIILYLSIYFFLRFLSDFIAFPAWVHVILIVLTGVNIVFAAIERPDLKLDTKTFQIVSIPGVHNPIGYRAYIGYVLLYLALAFGVLAIAFLVYGFRSAALARFRMLCIGGGFLLFCIVIGLLPRLLFGDPSAQTIKTLLNALRYVALATGPLLFVGFAPPGFVRRLFPETAQEAAPPH
jgi:hypothetical protein